MPGHKRAIAAIIGFTDYRDTFRIGHFATAVVDEADTWDPRTNAVRFVATEYNSEWSYKGDAMNLTIASPQLACDLRLTNADQVMYAKDKLDIKHPNNISFEGPFAPRDARETVGVAVTESMDVASCRMRRMPPNSIDSLKKHA